MSHVGLHNGQRFGGDQLKQSGRAALVSGDLRGDIGLSVGKWAEDVRARRFPAEAETYFSKKAVEG